MQATASADPGLASGRFRLECNHLSTNLKRIKPDLALNTRAKPSPQPVKTVIQFNLRKIKLSVV